MSRRCTPWPTKNAHRAHRGLQSISSFNTQWLVQGTHCTARSNAGQAIFLVQLVPRLAVILFDLGYIHEDDPIPPTLPPRDAYNWKRLFGYPAL
eukprot:412153-Rhodomonas_salina.1